MHRVGGLEKQDITGNVSYDPENHDHMVRVRARKVENVASVIPPQAVDGPDSGELLVLSWGGVYGACASAVARMQQSGVSVALANVRHVHPMPSNMAALLSRYRRVLIPELNSGQLRMLIRSKFLIDAVGLNRTTGRPFSAVEIEESIKNLIW
jgi:2-oxoglutarate ferredoxin oxidoreductase subunit alpha